MAYHKNDHTVQNKLHAYKIKLRPLVTQSAVDEKEKM